MSLQKKYLAALIGMISVIFIFFLGFPFLMDQGSPGRVKMSKDLKLNFISQDPAQIVLLYFGYVGCETICEPSLEEIALMYEQLRSNKKIKVYFINIDNQTYGAEVYARYFHTDFIGLDLPKSQTMELMQKLHVYASASLSGTGALSHTGHLYFLTHISKQDYKLKYIYYSRPFNVQNLYDDITKELL